MSSSSKTTRGLRALRIHRAVCSATLAAAGMFAGERALAADIDWVRAPGNPGSFTDAANWAGGVVPGPGDNGYINNGGIATAAAAVNATFNDLRVGFNPGSSGSLSITGGTINAQGNMAFGSNTTGAGTFNISSGALNVGGGTVGDLSFGDDGVGTATISGGTVTTRFAYVGKSTHGSGHVTQTGGSFIVQRNFVMDELKPADTSAVQNASDYTMSGGFLSVGSEFYIGAHGPATFNLSGTGSINSVGAVHIAASGGLSDPPAGSGTLNMSAGTFNVSGVGAYFVVGDGGDGIFNFSGGSLTSKYYNVGQNFQPGFSTKGIVNQTGGSARVEYAWVIGEQSRSANLYDLSAGTVTVVGTDIPELPGDLNIASGPGSRGTLTVRGTGVATVANSALIGNAQFASGSLNVSGNGSLSLGNNGLANGFLVVGVQGTGNVNMSGGSVIADGMTLGQNSTGLGTGTQTGGRMTIRGNMSVGETSPLTNVYDISGGTLAVGTLPTDGIYIASSGVGTLKVGGTATVTAPALTNKGAYAQTGGVASLGVITGTGSISVSGGTLNATSIAQGTLSLSSTGVAKIAVNGTNTGLSVLGNLSVTGSSKLDLNDNDMIVHNGNYATVTGLIRTARNGGAWNQPGITSGSAATAVPKNKTLGTVTGAEFHTAQGAAATFDGATVVNSDLLVKYTYYGDADLNGQVNFDDYSRIDAGFNNVRTGWFNGDFDYSGGVDFDDYSLIDNAFNTQSGTLRRAMSYLDGGDRSDQGMSTPALQLVMDHFAQFGQPYANGFLNAVPEPTSALVFTGLAALAASGRRRRAHPR